MNGPEADAELCLATYAAGLVSGDGRATNQFAAAWWGKLFSVMANTSPHIERLYQYTITESPTFDLLWDATYGGLAGSRAGRDGSSSGGSTTSPEGRWAMMGWAAPQGAGGRGDTCRCTRR